MPISPLLLSTTFSALAFVVPVAGAGALLACWVIAQDARDGLEHFVVVKGFGDVIHRAHFHRVDCRAQAGVAGHDQHRRALAELDQLGAGCARVSAGR